MNFSLIQVTSSKDGMVKGVWVQHHVGGTIETATQAAIRTEAANGQKQDIAVIPHDSTLNLNHGSVRCTGAKRLDTKRVTVAPSPYGRWPDDWN